jgi:exonuclease SbcC
MTNLSPNSNSGTAVHSYLRTILPNAQLTDVTVASDYQPLLLMQNKHVMAGFAFANGDMRKSYETLYGSFKKIYAEQHGKWDAFDLSFIFCIHTDAPQIYQFCSNVETDIYFCRKFVIPLAEPLEVSLGRLPFLPLAQVTGQPLRPPSAQTLLQQCGVPAPLAKAIVVQNERSPAGIVEDCSAGDFGELKLLTRATPTPAIQSEHTTDSVKLETLEIQNFRAYRKPQIFALGAEVTVLYGPNGFGKTSFFDAVDFAVTGGIGRLESRQGDFAKTARHLDAGSERSAVSLTFRSNGVVRQIVRSVDDRKQALLDGRPTDRKAILSELTRGDIPATDRVENFVSLFRASHLFSQEQQELTKNFEHDCQLNSDVVSRMLAFEDYANAVKKAANVRQELETVIANAGEEIRILTEQITADKKELERLGQTAKAHTNVSALDKEIEELQTKLSKIGIAVTTAKPDATIVRGWRAVLESRLSQSKTTNERLTVLAKELAMLPRIQADLAAGQQQLIQKEDALKTVEEKRIAVELAVQIAEKRLAEMISNRANVQKHAELLEWVRNTQPGFVQSLAQQRQLTEELEFATRTLAELRTAEDKAAGEVRSKEATAVQIGEKLQATRATLLAAKALQQVVPNWQVNLARLATVLLSEKTQFKELETLRVERRELAPQAITVNEEEQRLVRQISEIDKNQSEMRTLVSKLQGHVTTGTCPLCGEEHGSKSQLLERIQKHVAADAASGARADLTVVRERAKKLAERVAANNQKQEAVEVQLAALKNERIRLESEIAHFTTSASKLAIAVEAEGAPTPVEQIGILASRLQLEVAELEKSAQAAGTAVEAARVTLTNAKILVGAKKTEAAAKQVTIERLREETNRLRADTRLTQISLDIEPSQLAELTQLNLNNLTDFKAEAAKAEAEANKKKTEMGGLRQEFTSLKAQLAAIRTQLGNLLKSVTQITAKLEEFKLPLDSSEKSLLALISEESRLLAQLIALQDSTSNLELAMDAATTAAALTTLRQTVRNREKALAQAVVKRDQHKPWLKYFEEVSRLLSSQQSDAIANFTHEYGPRTSVIQRRLRSVYGFDDIEIRSRESTISVRVKRNGEELRPIDYFSQSQQQTLLLGLFLTACSSQTWSAFSPVFLDDPVTHFDDLNTYAFLDLVVGLLESEVYKRQFVISTCDEKLLQLARQKFRHLGDSAKFYQFTAIGSDGPTVQNIF